MQSQGVLGSTAVNKASGCNEIPAELFRSLKDDAIKAAFIMSANLEDPAVATGLEKVNPYPKSPRRVVPKKVLSIGQLYLSPVLVRSWLKSCMLGFSITRTKNFQMSKLGLEKEEEPEIDLPTFTGL